MKYILITGANGGLASAIISRLLQKGDFVIGLDITEPKKISNNYLGISVDITKDESVKNAYIEVLKVTDRIDCIINTAGIMKFGSMIEEEPEVMERMIQTNVMGMYRINYFFMPLVEKSCDNKYKGRIINFSSEYGKYKTIPFNGFYTLTKHAVESYTDGLRRELKYLGIKVITIRPGAFKTNMQKSIYNVFDNIIDKTEHYKRPLKKLSGMLTLGSKNAKDAIVLAKVVEKAVYTKRPRKVYKKNYNFLVSLLSILPNWLVDGIFYRFFK